ncbi:hypothetical protein Dimus_039615 [Dionaea muscipula]
MTRREIVVTRKLEEEEAPRGRSLLRKQFHADTMGGININYNSVKESKRMFMYGSIHRRNQFYLLSESKNWFLRKSNYYSSHRL